MIMSVQIIACYDDRKPGTYDLSTEAVADINRLMAEIGDINVPGTETSLVAAIIGAILKEGHVELQVNGHGHGGRAGRVEAILRHGG